MKWDVKYKFDEVYKYVLFNAKAVGRKGFIKLQIVLDDESNMYVYAWFNEKAKSRLHDAPDGLVNAMVFCEELAKDFLGEDA